MPLHERAEQAVRCGVDDRGDEQHRVGAAVAGAVTAAISTTEGVFDGEVLHEALRSGSVAAFINTCVALLVATLVLVQPSALPLLGVVVVLLVLVFTAGIIFLTELTSNTATAATFLPVAGGVALGLGVDPMLLAIPVALAATCAFMLPVATPPNAIAYGSGS